MTDVPALRPAATVALLRGALPEAEVLLLERHGGHAFMPSVHVFPGGRVEAQDQALAEHHPGAALAPFGVAALRVAAEESGLLLARDAGGAWAAPEAARAAFEALEQGAGFAEVLGSLDLCLALDALRPLGWWITPPFETRRYDTRFFIAAAPPQQTATHDAVEHVGHGWMTPAEAVRRFHAGTLALAPPTLATLELLEAFQPLDDLPAGIAERPIEPHLTHDADGTPVLALPGDPLFPGEVPRVLPHRTRFRRVGGRFV